MNFLSVNSLFSRSRSIKSAVITPPKPFDNVVGSFNADVPKGAWVRMDARVGAAGKWSPWFCLTRWDGGIGGRSLGDQANSWGRVDVDTLKLNKKATAFQYRVKMHDIRNRPPVLTRAAVAYIDSHRLPRPMKPFRIGPWVREIKLRPRSQIEEQKRISSRLKTQKPILCAPVSLSMVLERWGYPKKTEAVATLGQDRRTLLFGNWPVNVQAAALLGLAGHVARLGSLEDLQDEIARGRPVVVSVTIRKGDLSAQPNRKTAGHLMVVAGFTRAGDVIAYDPLAASKAGVRRIYPRREFWKIWLKRKHGLAYILEPKSGKYSGNMLR